MKAITIKQPWASLIINGYKKYEFRSWKTNYRGELLIHAGKGTDKKALSKFKDLNLDYPVGKIIGKVTLTDCIQVTPSFEKELIKGNELVYGNTINRSGYAWKLDNINIIDSGVEINGQLGLWNFDY